MKIKITQNEIESGYYQDKWKKYTRSLEEHRVLELLFGPLDEEIAFNNYVPYDYLPISTG